MDELIRQGQWWWPFLVPVATGVLALAGSWAGSKWGKTAEHKQWRRNQRQEAYLGLFGAMGEYQTACIKVFNRLPDAQTAIEQAKEAADRMHQENYRYMATVPKEVPDAMVTVLSTSTKLLEAAVDGITEGVEASRDNFRAALVSFGAAVLGVRELARQDLQMHKDTKKQQKALAKTEKELMQFQLAATEINNSKNRQDPN